MAGPISDHADKVLRSLPLPHQEINAGVRWRLERSGYIEARDEVSPYKTHKGKKIPHAYLTAKGEQYLKDGI